MADSDPQSTGKKQHPGSPAGEADATHDLETTYVQEGQDQKHEDDAGQETTAADGGQSTQTKGTGAAPQKRSRTSSAGAAKKKVTRLGDFKLVRRLGKGGMGEVFLARQISLDRDVALKTLSSELAKKPDFVERFLREARSMARLHHPNIIQVYAVDTVKGLHFAAIEYIDGRSMQAWMDELGRLSVGDALHVTLRCAEALQHAHEKGMVHRDVKPDNILVTRSGLVKVSDFGLAKAIDEDVSVTRTGAGLGTPLYMAPEQARNAKYVDKRSDIYALGGTLYYFLTGQLPFTGDDTLKLIEVKEQGKFPPVRRSNRDVPERLDLIVDKMLAVQPQHRYADCDELMNDLLGLQLDHPRLSFTGSGATEARPSTAGSASGASVSSQTAQTGSTEASTGGTTDPAERRQPKSAPTEPETAHQWIVRHTNAQGKVVINKMSTRQVTRGLDEGTLGLKTKAKKSVHGDFLPLAHFAEFKSLVKKQAARAKAESRGGRMKDLYEQIDKQERRRRRWRWLRNLTEGVLGYLGLLLYLAVLAAAGYGLYLAIPWAYQWIAEQFNMN